MKEAQDLRDGNIIKIGNDLFIILKSVYNKGARNASLVKMKLKNLVIGSITENVFKASDKFEQVVLDRRPMQLLYNSDGVYYFMDQETFEQFELSKEDLGDNLNFIKDEMIIDIVVYEGKPVGVEIPDKVALKITYTEPAVKGDTGGQVLKSATLETGFEIQVPLYCVIDEMIKVDTTTGKFVSRA